ncbi:MAG: phosphodiester glycosidase family protein [Eubacteriales bacterium]|nr:phosphodiester glycosidase family protein [Eubacteriales bacterium]
MSKKNQVYDYAAEEGGRAAPKPPKKKKKGTLGRVVRRFFLVLFTVIVLLLAALVLAANVIFNGPSPAAQVLLTQTLLEPSATKWIPALFIGEDRVAEIKAGAGVTLTDEVSNTDQVVINRGNASGAAADEWADDPDGIRFEDYAGDTYNAHIMIVRDPSQVYLGLSNYNGFSRDIPGKRINQAMEDEGALAAVNAGAFFDNGTTSPQVGSTPEGVVFSGGQCHWKTGAPPNDKGFVGFNTDDVLVVHTENISEAQAQELNIRDGCCFGPVLIMNGEPNMEAYGRAGINPRTAIGQRADGAVVFVCIDGRQIGSPGGSFADVIDIMTEYGVVNACNMDGGSSSVMMYRDTLGKFGEAGALKMINNYSLLQSEPRRMPNYWMVRPAE